MSMGGALPIRRCRIWQSGNALCQFVILSICRCLSLSAEKLLQVWIRRGPEFGGGALEGDVSLSKHQKLGLRRLVSRDGLKRHLRSLGHRVMGGQVKGISQLVSHDN